MAQCVYTAFGIDTGGEGLQFRQDTEKTALRRIGEKYVYERMAQRFYTASGADTLGAVVLSAREKPSEALHAQIVRALLRRPDTVFGGLRARFSR